MKRLRRWLGLRSPSAEARRDMEIATAAFRHGLEIGLGLRPDDRTPEERAWAWAMIERAATMWDWLDDDDDDEPPRRGRPSYDDSIIGRDHLPDCDYPARPCVCEVFVSISGGYGSP